MKYRSKFSALFLTILILAAAAPVMAAGVGLTLYATMGDSSFVSLDTATGEATLVFNSHLYARTLCFDYDNELLYALDVYDPVLTVLDPGSGAVLEIGHLNVGGNDAYRCEGLAYNQADGQLYASVSMNGSDTVSETFVTVDPTDASCAIIGTFRGSLHNEADALTFIDGQCYSIDSPGSGPTNFYAVDHIVDPGSSSLIRRYDSPLYENINDLAYDPGSGELYGYDPNQPARLLRIDPATGVITVVGFTHAPGEFSGSSVFCLSFGHDGSTGVAATPRPVKLALWPNPCNPRLEIGLTLEWAGDVRVSVADLRGRMVRELHAGALDAGRTSLIWDGRDAAGRAAPSGVYTTVVNGGGARTAERFTLVR